MDGEYASTHGKWKVKMMPIRQCTVNNRIMGASDAGQEPHEWGMVRKISGRIFNRGILLRETTRTI